MTSFPISRYVLTRFFTYFYRCFNQRTKFTTQVYHYWWRTFPIYLQVFQRHLQCLLWGGDERQISCFVGNHVRDIFRPTNSVFRWSNRPFQQSKSRPFRSTTQLHVITKNMHSFTRHFSEKKVSSDAILPGTTEMVVYTIPYFNNGWDYNCETKIYYVILWCERQSIFDYVIENNREKFGLYIKI